MGGFSGGNAVQPSSRLIGSSWEFRQASKPATRPGGSALVSGDCWQEPGFPWDWEWNGSVWLSRRPVILLNYGTGSLSATSTQSVPYASLSAIRRHTNCDAYIKNFGGSISPIAATNGTNYWSIDVLGKTITSTGSGVIATLSFTAAIADQSNILLSALNSQVASNFASVFLRVQKVATAPDLDESSAFIEIHALRL